MNEMLIKILSLIENLLINPLIWIFPIKWTIVLPGSSSVRFTLGYPSMNLGSGIHFATTGQTLQTRHVNTKSAIAESMYVLTEDGVSLRIRGVAIYRIISLVDYLTATEDSDEFVIEACEAAIKHGVSKVPYEDLVSDSDTVEQAISEKISEICDELGIKIIRYRFQDVEFTDPIGRGLSSMKAMEPKLTASAKKMARTLSITHKDALAVLSPNIQFVTDITSDAFESSLVQEENNES